jgi:RNA polymerase sigma factor (sigma-70 family)
MQYPILNNEEIAELSKKGNIESLNRIIESNLRFVVYVVLTEFKGYTERFLFDLIQQGNVGLCLAARKFESDRGYTFLNYAAYYVRSYIKNFIDVHAPFFKMNSKNLIMRKNILKKFGMEYKNIEDIAVAFDIKTDKAKELLLQRETLSLNATNEHDEEFIGVIPADDDSSEDKIYRKELKNKLQSVLKKRLNKKELTIIEHRYGLNNKTCMTLSELSKKLGISGERIRQLEQKSLKELRRKSIIDGIINESN